MSTLTAHNVSVYCLAFANENSHSTQCICLLFDITFFLSNVSQIFPSRQQREAKRHTHIKYRTHTHATDSHIITVNKFISTVQLIIKCNIQFYVVENNNYTRVILANNENNTCY